MDTIIHNVKTFVNRKVIPSANYFDRNNIYPTELVEIMKSIGLFGLTIPKVYGGLECDLLTYLKITEELSSGSVGLSSLLDSHLTVCYYINNFGTDEQKTKFLPLLAKGKLIATNVHNEKNIERLETSETCVVNINHSSNTCTLSGGKNLVTNSNDADLFAISGRIIEQCSNIQSADKCIVLVEKNTIGLKLEKHLGCLGTNGKSSSSIIFENCILSRKDILSGLECQSKTMIDSAYKITLILLSARAYGIAKRLIEKCTSHLVTKNVNGKVENLADESFESMKLTELITKFHAGESLYKDCCSNFQSIDEKKLVSCKIFLTETNKDIALLCLQIFAGTGYTSEYGMEQYLRDSLSLSTNNFPADTLLHDLTHMTLDNYKLKLQNPSSILFKYAPVAIPELKREFIQQATLEEQERIINVGYYRNTNIQLFFYDMTTMNPSGSFKDFIGCYVFSYCLQNNIHCLCAQSSGNTAMSFINHARKHPSIKLIQFYLTQNSFKINPSFISDNVTLIEVNSTETEMKRILKRFSELTGIPVLPNLDIEIQANKIRAYFLQDYCDENKINFDWYVQSISSGGGPFGLYQGCSEIGEKLKAPKLLAIQQQALCPYARALGYWDDAKNGNNTDIELLEPTLFRSDPSEHVPRLKNILNIYGGKIKVLKNDNFNTYADEAVALLEKNNIFITRRTNGSILEKSGVLALASALHELDSQNYGSFSANERILIGITGGAGSAAAQNPKPKLTFHANPTDEEIKLILEYI